MTDASERARAEQLRRAEAMVDAQRFHSQPAPCTPTTHTWAPCRPRDRYMICEVCAATIPPPEAEPGVQVVSLE